MDRCDECGFDPESVNSVNGVAAVNDIGRRWQAPLTRFLPGEDGDALVCTRPDPTTWSAIEYGGHVRDVLALFDRRVRQIEVEDHPVLEIVDHESAVRDGSYATLSRDKVVAEIGSAASVLAATLAALDAAAWNRSGTRDGEERTILDIARRAVHEGRHHLLDAGRALRAARGR